MKVKSIYADIVVAAQRKKWQLYDIKEALELLKSNNLKMTAFRMGVTEDAIRMALTRAGINVAEYRKHFRKAKKSRSWAREALIAERASLAIQRYEGGCKWPIGDLADGDLHWCEARREWNKPYCERHDKMSRLPVAK